MTRFLVVAEGELPHGHRQRNRIAKLHTPTTEACNEDLNFTRQNMATTRDTFAHQKRGRVSNLAGWAQSGKGLLVRMKDPGAKLGEFEITDVSLLFSILLVARVCLK